MTNYSNLPDKSLPDGFSKASLQTGLMQKADAITMAIKAQIAAYSKLSCPTTPGPESLGLMAPGISVVIPEGLH